MTAAATACATALSSQLGDAVLLPGSAAYEAAMARLIFAEAALKRPPCIIQPEDTAGAAIALRLIRENGGRATVRGGSHSALCASDEAVMIDLSAHMDTAQVAGEHVRLGGGGTMGTLLRSLAPRSRIVPVGVSLTPGMGLALRGGVGYLSRSLGLTLDRLREVEIVVPSGEVLHLSGDSAGEEADLWWGVRGCGPHLGVVTSATFQTRPLARVFVQRLVLGLEALADCWAWASTLPRHTNASMVVGTPGAGPGAPVVYLCIVYAGDDDDGVRRTREGTREYLSAVGVSPLLETSGLTEYLDIPTFDVPLLDGSLPRPEGASPPAARPPEERVFAFVKSRFLREPLDGEAAATVASAIRAAPTSLCRFDFQHLGGAVSDVDRRATAFWHRDCDWNWVITGAWKGPAGERAAATRWVRETAEAMADYTLGNYVVEVRPGLPETAAEVEMSFGENLPRLRELKGRWDPEGVLGAYFEL